MKLIILFRSCLSYLRSSSTTQTAVLIAVPAYFHPINNINMKTGSVTPAVFAKQKFVFSIISMICVALFSFFTGSAQIAGSIGVHTATPNSLFEVNGSFGQNVTTITANTTLGATHSIVMCNNGATKIDITLPTAVGITGRIYTIKKTTSTDSIVTLLTTSAQLIDGSSTLVLSDIQGAVTIVSDGTGWNIIDKYLAPYPMGEVSFFNVTGTAANVTGLSSGASGNDNMVPCIVTTAYTGMTEFDNGGTNNGTLRYVGRTPRMMHIACTISVAPATSNDQFVFGVAKNGTLVNASKILQKMGNTSDIQSTAIHVVISMVYGDYLQLYVGNTTASGRDVTIKSLNLFALGM